MPYMYSEMQNKLSKTRESPLKSMGQIISSRCPYSEPYLEIEVYFRYGYGLVHMLFGKDFGVRFLGHGR